MLMIDPHVHLRDWEESSKARFEDTLELALSLGLRGVFEMPNTSPPITSEETLTRRLADADKIFAGKLFHGIYLGLTADPLQQDRMIKLAVQYAPRVVGLKLYAAHSTGGLGLIDFSTQEALYQRLAEADYRGVLAIHAEKECFFDPLYRGSPQNYHRYRNALAEAASILDQLQLASKHGFAGHLHFCHISSAAGVSLIKEAKKTLRPLSAGITPHHLMLNATYSQGPQGQRYRVNPPLRDSTDQEALREGVLSGVLDCLESDHAPHSLEDKEAGAAGMPSLELWGNAIEFLEEAGMGRKALEALVGGNVLRIWKLDRALFDRA